MKEKIIGVYGYSHYAESVSSVYKTAFIPFKELEQGIPSYINADKYSAIIFTGGEDIAPDLYGEKALFFHARKYADSYRDQLEVALMRHCFKIKLPTIGICRGMQLQCVLNGGKLIQHVDNHNGPHLVSTEAGRFQVNSIHHQMCWPWASNEEFRILAHAKKVASVYYGHMNTMWKPEVEPEAILWPQTKALGVQWHPEGIGTQEVASKWFLDQVYNLLGA